MNHKRQSFRVGIATNENGSGIVLTSGEHFHLDIDAIQAHLGAALSLRMMDLLRIASAVYVADRTKKRGRTVRSVGWSRSMKLTLELIEPELLERAED